MSEMKIKIVGMVAGERRHIVTAVREGDPVVLLPEPDNVYDANAIAVYTAPGRTLIDSEWTADGWKIGEDDLSLIVDRQVGYVPAAVAARVVRDRRIWVGTATDIRYGPPEYEYDVHGVPREVPGKPAGFDVAIHDIKIGATR